jgi:hypothetical protein
MASMQATNRFHEEGGILPTSWKAGGYLCKDKGSGSPVGIQQDIGTQVESFQLILK